MVQKKRYPKPLNNLFVIWLLTLHYSSTCVVYVAERNFSFTIREKSSSKFCKSCIFWNLQLRCQSSKVMEWPKSISTLIMTRCQRINSQMHTYFFWREYIMIWWKSHVKIFETLSVATLQILPSSKRHFLKSDFSVSWWGQ